MPLPGIEDRGSWIVDRVRARKAIFDPRSSILDPQPSSRPVLQFLEPARALGEMGEVEFRVDSA